LNTSGTVANTQQEDSDPFYDALKSRVSQRLLECGINPEEDRCATWGRCAYYSVILVFLIISAYYHVKANILGSFSFALFGWLVGALGTETLFIVENLESHSILTTLRMYCLIQVMMQAILRPVENLF
jgi:hypothetical protein